MVVGQRQTARDVSSGNGGTISQNENAVRRSVAAAHRLQNFIRGDFRRLEVHRDGAIAPGIIELMATVGDEGQIEAELSRDFVEASGLVAEFGGEEQHPLVSLDRCFAHTNPSGAVIGCGCEAAFFATVPMETS